MKNNVPYIYNEGGYEYLSIHRRVLAYDPRNTDNPIIHEYFNESKKRKENSHIFSKLISKELDRYKDIVPQSIPISFKMIYHEINIAWIDIIHQMIFVNRVYNTFYGEYKDVIENIVLSDTMKSKECLVYRYHTSGESVFHLAAKLWILERYLERRKEKIYEQTKQLNEDFRYVLTSYCYLENAMNSKFAITYMPDFYKTSMLDYLQDFINKLKNDIII